MAAIIYSQNFWIIVLDSKHNQKSLYWILKVTNVPQSLMLRIFSKLAERATYLLLENIALVFEIQNTL